MEFKEKLMQLRKERGWSQEELGERLSVTRQTVSKWELGQTTPELAKLIEMSELFGMSIDELVGKEKSPAYPEKAAVEHETDTSAGMGSSAGYQGFSFGHPYRTVYEYKSERKLGRLPLVHVHFGRGNCTAKGIIAIGNIAVGLVSIGLVSFGLLAIGLVCCGLLAFGLTCLGVVSAGAVALGILFAAGGVVVSGYLAIGGVAAGTQIAVGGCVSANSLAIGGAAAGTIAVGQHVDGAVTFVTDSHFSDVDWNAVRAVVAEQCPKLPEWLVNLICGVFKK